MVPSRDTRIPQNRHCYNCGESVSQADDANKKLFALFCFCDYYYLFRLFLFTVKGHFGEKRS